MKSQIRQGAIIAYVNIVLNLLVNIFLTPFLIKGLGDAEYGVYKIVQSFSAQLSIMSFGIATLVTRNTVYYNTQGNQKEKENFLFIAKAASVFLAVMVTFVGLGLHSSIDAVYANTMNAEEIQTAKTLFLVLLANIVVAVLTDTYNGLLRAHEKFAISNGLNTVRVLIRIAVIVCLIQAGVGSVGIVLTDLGISVAIFLFTALYSRLVLKERSKFYYLDKKMIATSLVFSASIFLQAIANQVNQTLDNVILGAMVSASVVTVYSCGLTLYAAFTSLITVVGSMYGPKATRLVAQGADGEQLTSFAIEPARFQSMIAGLAIAGFVLFGKNFIAIWLGEGYEDVYIITLILIVPSVIPLIENITNSILDAMLKRLTRSLILIGMCVINVILSIILIHLVGYIGAAIGTAASVLIGHGIVMNIYLHKHIHLNIPRLFKSVFSGVLPACVLSIIVGIPISLLPDTFVGFVCKAALFCIIYAMIMYRFGMNPEEKSIIKGVLNKFKKQK